MASDDHLHGTTTRGNMVCGIIFKFGDNHFQYQKMIEFNDGTEGYYPTGHLLNKDGKIYTFEGLDGDFVI